MPAFVPNHNLMKNFLLLLHFHFDIGQVTGKRKALFIGINYVGQKGELRGCHNDVKNIRAFLESNYPLDEIQQLMDEPGAEDDCLPTKANILKGFKWLRANAEPGDSLILNYSGHGGSQKDLDGDEGTEL